ncbi:hypothetical protein CRUP_013869 [Coryphaenoides rupestris]|nr:hypothetical protein CRUP_013869 [Coryphaenoides rupestris]
MNTIENATVVGFEAMISSQIITLQIKDKSKMDDCQPDVSSATGTLQSGSGHVVMDEDLERTVLVVNLGVIPPMETVSILVSTSSELSTLADGGIRVCSPPVCTPKVQRTVNEEQGLSPNFTRTRERSAMCPNEQTPNSTQLCLVSLLEEESINSMDYQFNFNLEIRAPYLLAGVESPSHAIRADADPLARSATSVVITLADKYTYDCPVEILIYPSERNFQPLSVFIVTVDIIHKRLHKDVLHNPVVMLNFCPDLKLLSSDLRRVHGEFIFLIDRSGSMSGISINRVKDAMVVILKSLVPGCLFNILGFGSTFKALFTTSQDYQEDTLAQACDYVRRMIRSLKRAMMSPVLSDIAIEWLFPETKEVLLSPVSSSFLFPGDRLIGYSVVCDTTRYHPNPNTDKRRRYSMMRSNESASSVFFHSQEEEPWRSPGSDAQGPQTPLSSSYQDSVSESSPVPTQQDAVASRRRAYSTNQIVDYNPAKKAATHSDPTSVVGKNPLRRAQVQELIGQTSPVDYGAQWMKDYQGAPFRRLPSTAFPAAAAEQQQQGFTQEEAPDAEPQTHSHTHAAHTPHAQEDPLLVGSSMAAGHPAAAAAAGLAHQGTDGSRSSTDSPSVGSLGDAAVRGGDPHPGHPLPGAAHCAASSSSSSSPTPSGKGGDCMAVVTGLLCGEPVRWEVAFDIKPYLNGREREEKVHEELWNETFHHLAGRSILRDFEHMAEKKGEIEHGSGRRYQLYAIHTSKACNILSKYTTFVPIDLDTNEYLETSIEYINACEDGASPCTTPSSSGWERCSLAEASQRSPSVTSDQSQKSMEGLFSASKTGDSVGESDNKNNDYIPVVSLQLACGAFQLDAVLCEAISVPMDKLKWTSPFSSHRASLGPHLPHSAARRNPEGGDEVGGGGGCKPETSQQHHHHQNQQTREQWGGGGSSPSSSSLAVSPLSTTAEPALSPHSQTDSGRGSETESQEAEAGAASPLRRPQDVESMVWATAVALAWLEHSSAGYFIEWELVAAKASMWLSAQSIPERRDLASVKAAANQLFIILRHWDENLQLNMLCYNPNSV